MSPVAPPPGAPTQRSQGALGISLDALRGQPVVLAFSPPGWDPSREQQRALFEQLVRQGGGWEEEVEAPEGFPVIRDLDADGEAARAFGVRGERALVVLDAEGEVRWRHTLAPGVPPRLDDILAALQALAGGAEPEPLAPAGGWEVRATRRQFVATALAAAFALAVEPVEAAAAVLARPEVAAGSTAPVTLHVNGTAHRLDLDPRVTVLDALREYIGMTGTKKGCNHGQCGACTVLMEGQRVYSCLALAHQHDGDRITTVEGLARSGELHPVQAAFVEHDGFQCGYCTPGQICSAVGMLEEVRAGSASHVTAARLVRAPLTEAEIRERMSGNLCRCGAYNGIVAAVQDAARRMGVAATA
jgi:xanthine dehydrogenase YagT iron-sulfur-binding subunit